MLQFSYLKTAIGEKTEKTKNIFVLLIIFIFAVGAPIVINDLFILFIFFLSLGLFILKKKKIDPIAIFIIFVWILINLLAAVNFHRTFDSYTFAGFIIKLLYPYFILKVVGGDIWEKLEKVVFVLTIISIPIFIFQLFFPDLFFSLSQYFSFMTRNEQRMMRGWYAGIYMFSAWAPNRNSGFMWEPGGFAFVLVLFLTYRILKYGIIIDKRNLIYIIALGTTFSTMGYFVVTIIFIMYILKERKYKYVMIIAPILFIYGNAIFNLEFLAPKVSAYVANMNKLTNPTGYEYLKYNRFGYFIYALKATTIYPWGYGIFSPNYDLLYGSQIEGVGTISGIMIYWGWIGVIFFIYSIYRFTKLIQFNYNFLVIVITTIILIFAFFSNPLEKSPLLYLIIFSPFIFKNKILNTYAER